ncbi:N-acetyltransferase [Gramella sp. BOM4]|nr:N-acetyltransferase [Christiangramia bathymodioli]
MSDYKSFETERLLIRPASIEDAGFILELFNSPKWLQFIGDRNLKTEEDARKYIEDVMLPQLRSHGFSNNIVIRKSDGRKMGSCGLYDREGLEGIDLGFAFLPDYEGKGYAIEAASEIVRAAKEEFGIDRLEAITLEENAGSRKLLEKLGFELKGTIRIPNDPEELMHYKLDL